MEGKTGFGGLKMKAGKGKTRAGLAYLTALGAWGLAFGCSVGQGAFVMPGTVFLPIAGPVGTLLGVVLGALVMIVLARNFHLLMNRYPDNGGTYTYTKKCFGYDHGFLSAWFLLLAYIAVLWANASALPVVARTLLGSTFQFGFHYEIAGFHVYLGEILLSVLALAVGAFLCLRRSLAARTQSVMGILLLAGVIICFAAALLPRDGAVPGFDPPFDEQGNAFFGTLTILTLAPWMYVGFESISHSAAEVKYPLKKTFRILVIALLAGAAAYGLLALLAVTALPEGIGSWPEYVSRLGEYSGVQAQPTFFAAQAALGGAGKVILGIAACCGIFTGIIGNYIALSRLMVNLAEDGMMPEWIGKTDGRHTPRRAILVIFFISLALPFFGRTWISWIVDVTTVGATIAYAFASAAAWKTGREMKDRVGTATGAAGVLLSLFFALAFLIPNLLSVKTLATESYLILAAWGFVGYVTYLIQLRRDERHRLGRSNVALIVMFGLILFTSGVWMVQTSENAVEASVEPIQSHFAERMGEAGREIAEDPETGRELRGMLGAVEKTFRGTITVHVSMVVLTLAVLFAVYALIQKRRKKVEVEKALAEEASRAKTSFLSNMSHEIRTPMNAIIGLDNIALRNPDLQPQTREQLEKIGASAKHLLGLINDILDMSRIESGRVALKREEFRLGEILGQVNIMIHGQCADRGLTYECRVIGETADYYVGDDLKLKQVLINILGNAVKFTEAPGKVTLTVEQTEVSEETAVLRLVMRDTGVGMDAKYLPTIFEAFSQEDSTSTNRYGGSGLGMAITKSFVDMMDGEIQVESEKGVGTVFTVTLPLGRSDRVFRKERTEAIPEEELSGLLAGRRVLMAEDVAQNAEILTDILSLEEIEADHAENGLMAVEMFSNKPVGTYDAILMDVRMPVMDGLTATRKIRAMNRPDAGVIPIIAMTANVFDDDVECSLQAGMNAHLGKPVEPENLFATLGRLLQGKGK